MGRSKLSSSIALEQDITKEQAIAFLHSHSQMIELNPLVIRHKLGEAPKTKITPEEASDMLWYDVTDRIQYIPGIAALSSQVTYKAGFQNLEDGLRTHIFAPGGVELHGRWTVVEADALHLHEHVELSCFALLSAFVKKNLEKSHAVIAEKLAASHTHQ